MTMIELIFAIVVSAISVLSIPSIMNVANEASKQAVIDEDVMSRLSGWTIDKFQARWDGNYSASGSGILWVNDPLGGTDLECARGGGNVWYRLNPDSTVQCNDQNATATVIPTTVGNGANQADGNVSKGIEKLNGGTEAIAIAAASGELYDIDATYSVRYVSSAISATANPNIWNATWRLGSSGSMAPDGSTGTPTNLKRVVIRFHDTDLDVDTTLTFFKSNKGN
jgi:hypothetical protein